MIEINLIAKKKSTKLPTILGIDLNKLNYIGIIIAIIFYYVPNYFVFPQFKEREAKEQSKVDVLVKKYRKIKKEVDANKNIKDKLNAFNDQVRKLKSRSKQVDSIIKQKSNPKMVLESVARVIPEDMWFNSLEITEDRKLNIEGAALSYSSISDFLSAGNESNFFGKTLNLTGSTTKEITYKSVKVRVESYKINGLIESFNPWNEN